ncbi:hypothetical protein BDD12DRAFT_979420 [Trichophaea hybrida]|nr:hypothetical protein BDD12DRAFT_979420 [Trichophaea hybrida]
MDGLSVAASIAGLVQIASTVVNFISGMADASTTARSVLAEAQALQPIFHHLQDFILDFAEESDDQRSMIYVDDLIAILTGCVCTFTELERILDSLTANDHSGSVVSPRARIKLAFKDKDLNRIFGDLQKHKSSLNLMLMIITCKSTQRAQNYMRQLVQSGDNNRHKLQQSAPTIISSI